MTLDFSTKGKVKVGMVKYIEKMVDQFGDSYSCDSKADSPAANDLFSLGSGEILSGQKRDDFHTFVMKGMFACKRARPDIQMPIALLATRVNQPNADDWKKLTRVMRFLNGTRQDVLTLSADNLHTFKWYVDASFAVHPDFRSHTGAALTMGQGAILSSSLKQKLNTRLSCEAELVGADDMATKILWTKFFMEDQGYHVKDNVLFQDNKSTILLLENGKRSSGKRTRALNIRYFFLHDQKMKGNLRIDYCPTGDMYGDFFTKPLQGQRFKRLRAVIMGFT